MLSRITAYQGVYHCSLGAIEYLSVRLSLEEGGLELKQAA